LPEHAQRASTDTAASSQPSHQRAALVETGALGDFGYG
jgi:hypothetical protein